MHMKLLVTVTLLAAAVAWGQKFDLSTGKLELYSAERGYGFEEGATLKAGAGSATCEKPPFYFSMRVPEEGNYRVIVTLGDREAATVTTIKAELRRLMVEKVETRPGEFVQRTFLVNTRTPGIARGRTRHGEPIRPRPFHQYPARHQGENPPGDIFEQSPARIYQ